MERKKPAIELVKNNPAEARNTAPQSSRPEASKQEKPVLDERGLADMPFLILTVLLVGIGLIMLFSASYARSYEETGNAAYYFVRQAIFAVSGIGIMWVVSRLNYQVWRFGGFVILLVSLLFLVAVPFIGDSSGGATRWINLGFVRFQPSELAKLGMVLTFATMMSMWKDRMHTFRYGVAPYIGIMGVIAGLLFLEPHLSATLIIAAVGAIMMYQGGTAKKWFVFGAVGLAVLVVVYLNFKGYSSQRIQAWLDPDNKDYAQTIAYQINQSRMAIGSGGLTGLGFGKSRQKYLYLPEEHNDYIFAVVCEELGFLGAAAIILLFVLLIVRGYWLAMHARDRFGALTITGLISLLAIQVFLNIGVVSNLLPSTGIGLPFFSYGGTALWINLAEMGIILGVSRQNTNNIRTAEKRKKRKNTGGNAHARNVHLRRNRRSH